MFIPILFGIPIFSFLLAQSWNFIPKYFSSRIDSEKSHDFFSEQRQRMVSEQIQQRGITNPQVLEAMKKVPRHQFVLPDFEYFAYNDSALAIDYGQTISQPYIVAYMSEMANIQPEDKVLEIGTGSGYQAAILAELAQEVYSVEVIPALAKRAHQTLKKLGYDNIHLRISDGYKGWPENAPYQSILVTAAPEEIPQALIDQLAVNGRMIIPIGKYIQKIVIITKTKDGITKQDAIPVRFVPMVANH